MPPVDVKYAWAQLNGQSVAVEADLLNITEKIQAYDPNLRVQFLNDAARGVSEPPYRIVELCKDGVERTMFSVWTLDETVLQRIFAADLQKWDVQGLLDKTNAKARENEKRRYKEALAEGGEVTKAVLASPKDTYTVPEDVVKPGRGDPSKLLKFRSDTPETK